jgi:hypothetical protein
MDSINALACPFTITALSSVQTPHPAGLWQVSAKAEESQSLEVFGRRILDLNGALYQD